MLITVRFFQMKGEEASSFEQILERLHSKPKPEREIDIGAGENESFLVRLEHLDNADKPFVCGEFVRRVLTDNPPEATAEGLSKLSLKEGAGLGYQVAFAYHPELKTLAIEHTPRSLSLSRILLYMNMASNGKLSHAPIVNQDAWDRYGQGQPRKLVMTIADPSSLSAVEGDVGGVLTSTGKLNEIFDAPMITIEVSMGHKKGSLKEDAVSKLLNYFTLGDGKKHDVRTLKTKSKPDAGGRTEDIDFISEMLVARDSIDLHGDPEKNYEIRKNFVRSEFRKNLAYIRSVYGAPKAD